MPIKAEREDGFPPLVKEVVPKAALDNAVAAGSPPSLLADPPLSKEDPIIALEDLVGGFPSRISGESKILPLLSAATV